jgi:hypothetical protein
MAKISGHLATSVKTVYFHIFFAQSQPREKNMPFYEERRIKRDRRLLFLFRLSKNRKGGLLMATGSKLEKDFQSSLIKELKTMFPGCMVMKLDSGYIQGIPDLLVLHDDKWATLECKKYKGAKKQPNQEYYVGRMDEMSFSRFICPENKEEVLDELQQAFKP